MADEEEKKRVKKPQTRRRVAKPLKLTVKQRRDRNAARSEAEFAKKDDAYHKYKEEAKGGVFGENPFSVARAKNNAPRDVKNSVLAAKMIRRDLRLARRNAIRHNNRGKAAEIAIQAASMGLPLHGTQMAGAMTYKAADNMHQGLMAQPRAGGGGAGGGGNMDPDWSAPTSTPPAPTTPPAPITPPAPTTPPAPEVPASTVVPADPVFPPATPTTPATPATQNKTIGPPTNGLIQVSKLFNQAGTLNQPATVPLNMFEKKMSQYTA